MIVSKNGLWLYQNAKFKSRKKITSKTRQCRWRPFRIGYKKWLYQKKDIKSLQKMGKKYTKEIRWIKSVRISHKRKRK